MSIKRRLLPLVFLAIAGCGGSETLDKEVLGEIRELNNYEVELWNSITECFESVDSNTFGDIGYTLPQIQVVEERPCGSPKFYACYKKFDNLIVIDVDHYEEWILWHEFKHVILWQATGAADSFHDTIWFTEDSSC